MRAPHLSVKRYYWLVLFCALAIIATSAGREDHVCESGTCAERDHPGPDVVRVILSGDGSISIRGETYHPARYSSDVMRTVRQVQRSSHLLEQLEKEISNGDNPLDTIVDIISSIINVLLELSVLHKEQWMKDLALQFEEPVAEVLNDHSLELVDDHFNKAANAYETTSLIYQRIWNFLEGDLLLSIYDQETISTGQSTVFAQFSDLFQQRYNGRIGESATEDCSKAYHYLMQARLWNEKSMLLLRSSTPRAFERELHDQVIQEQSLNSGYLSIRRGIVLIDLYTFGFKLSDDNSMHQSSSGTGVFNSLVLGKLDEGQRSHLMLAMSNLEDGAQVYNAFFAENEGQYIEFELEYTANLADAYHYMASVHTYMNEWEEASDKAKTSMEHYEFVFDEYYHTSMTAEAIDIASQMISTSLIQFETFLYLPRKIDDAKDSFRRHLEIRRFVMRQTALDEPLSDDTTNQDGFAHQQDSFGDTDDSLEETLQQYMAQLEDYLKLKQETGPDGTYYETYFDEGASTVTHDSLYEGSMRLAIGSLLLDMSKLWEARSELESAITLLRDGISRGDVALDAYDDNGNLVNYPVEIDLANALLNLAYAQMGLHQWKRSYEAFEESMRIFEVELHDDEAPMNNAGLVTGSNSFNEPSDKYTSWRDRLSSFFQLGPTANEDGSGTGVDTAESESSGGIQIDSFEFTGNYSSTPHY